MGEQEEEALVAQSPPRGRTRRASAHVLPFWFLAGFWSD